jgi:hypothetical protein
VIPSVLLATLLSAAPGADSAAMLARPVGVVAWTRGEVVLTATTVARVTRSGAVLPASATLETGADGWVELRLRGGVRARLSSGARLRLGPSTWRLGSGRLWLEAPAGRGWGFALGLGRNVLHAEPGAAVVVDRAGPGPIRVAVRRGRVRVGAAEPSRTPPSPEAAPDAPVVVAGEVWTARPDGPGRVAVGGRALEDLVSGHAREALGDLVGVEAFVLAAARRAVAGAAPPIGPGQALRADPERQLAPSDGLGLALEEAIRVPPFFEEEVPPKGPNVRVEVDFVE